MTALLITAALLALPAATITTAHRRHTMTDADHCHHRSPIQPVFLCHLHHGHTGPHQAFPGNTRGHHWANDNDQEDAA